MDFDTKKIYTASELAELKSAWQEAGYEAVSIGSINQYRSGTIRWYAAYFSRYKRSVCLHSLGDDCKKREKYVALDQRMQLVKSTHRST